MLTERYTCKKDNTVSNISLPCQFGTTQKRKNLLFRNKFLQLNSEFLVQTLFQNGFVAQEKRNVRKEKKVEHMSFLIVSNALNKSVMTSKDKTTTKSKFAA